MASNQVTMNMYISCEFHPTKQFFGLDFKEKNVLISERDIFSNKQKIENKLLLFILLSHA